MGTHSHRRLLQTLVIIIAATVALALQESTLEKARHHRENLVRKYLKKLKKEEGAIKLVGGDGDYEGKLTFFFTWNEKLECLRVLPAHS